MGTVIVAEKPSVARDIARVLGARVRRDGWYEGNGYAVTWALGHLVHFAEPDDYGPRWKGRWSPAQLPMIPERWRLVAAPRTAAQLAVVSRLILAPEHERLVCATDAGREGEHIFRLILEHAGCAKPFERLWVSSLTDEAIRAGLAALKPGSAYDDLARAARARAQADWLVGMNLTRAYTVHNRVLCTIGRVQTPTLAMIVARDAEIAAFVAKPFYELVARFAEGFEAKYLVKGPDAPDTRLEDRAEAETIRDALNGETHGRITRLTHETRREPPPPLYDLTTLQRDANRRLGLTAARTLELAQALYERHKLISYPRTESRHIGEDMVDQLPGILRGLDHACAPAALARLESGHRLGRAYVDRTKLTDHHAILPTGKPVPAGLGELERRLFDLIATRFVCVFLPDRELAETRVLIDIGARPFGARGVVELEAGWRLADPPPRASGRATARGAAEREDTPTPESESQALPPLEEGQALSIAALELREGKTSPPRPYTDASLLAAMKQAGRTIDDRELARAMRAGGLGTPATRAETIEKLIRTGYVERRRKQLAATEKGRLLIGLVAAPLKSPELTAGWEQRLKEVEEGARPVEDFYRGIVDMVTGLLPQVWSGAAFTPAQAAALRPPRESGKGAAKGKRTSRRPSNGDRERPARGGPGQRPARAGARSAEATAPSPPPAPGPVGLTCPKCGRGHIIQGRRGFGCDRYREGCDFVVWREEGGRVRSDAEIAAIIRAANG